MPAQPEFAQTYVLLGNEYQKIGQPETGRRHLADRPDEISERSRRSRKKSAGNRNFFRQFLRRIRPDFRERRMIMRHRGESAGKIPAFVCHLRGSFSDLCGIMMTTAMFTASSNDAELVNKSLTGNCDAFGQIVARYQSLICSLAYSATGSLSQSEDLAQETFVTAWRQLRDLREPRKLRSWLCRIARNLTYDALRQAGREPSHHGEPLEEISEAHAPGPLPAEQTISNEEQAILWRSLEKISEIYREPLVLFYREHQSIEAVAQNLDLSEDAVKQRLARGRKLLHEQVRAFVEGALEKTAPGKTFTFGVLAAISLTVTSAKAAAVGTTIVKGATVSGSTMTSLKTTICAVDSDQRNCFTAKSSPHILIGPDAQMVR